MKAERIAQATELLQEAERENELPHQTVMATRFVVRNIIKAIALMLLAMSEACGGPSFSTAIDLPDGGTSTVATPATGGSLATGGSSATGGNVSTGGSSSSAALLTSGGSPIGGGLTTGGESSFVGRPSTGGSSAVVATSTTSIDPCYCPNNPQCEPLKGMGCASQMGVNMPAGEKCVRVSSRCLDPTPVYCFACE